MSASASLSVSGMALAGVAMLDHRLLGLPAEIDPALKPRLDAWCERILNGIQGPLRGLAVAGVPLGILKVLRYVGVPLSADGPLCWGRDILEQDLERPTPLSDDRLAVPRAEMLLELSSLGLKPLRIFIADRLGCRLQAASGIAFYLWEDRALLVSTQDLPLGGFLYGPHPGQRHSVVLEPGGHQVLAW